MKARVAVIADLHCGHYVGLTPPAWQWPVRGTKPGYPRDIALTQRKLWKEYAGTMSALQPIDLLIVNGDAIDGKGPKSGATEQITADRAVQCDMAVEAIQVAKAGAILMTYGTAYHVGDEEDWEAEIARRVGAKIGSHEWPEVNGVIFDVKHFIGRSTIPHGRLTPVARDRIWNLLWEERGEQPKADILIRSHVHYFTGAFEANWFAIITPALQAAGTKFGARRMSNTVDLGMFHFDVWSRDKWEPCLHRFTRAVRRASATPLASLTSMRSKPR